MAYIRGSQISFVVLPNMLAKAPFFNRIKMWRKFKGHAVFGGGGLIAGPARGQSAAIIQKSQTRRLQVQGALGEGAGGGVAGSSNSGQQQQQSYRPMSSGPPGGMQPYGGYTGQPSGPPRGYPPPGQEQQSGYGAPQQQYGGGQQQYGGNQQQQHYQQQQQQRY
jgi:hypothetical protein